MYLTRLLPSSSPSLPRTIIVLLGGTCSIALYERHLKSGKVWAVLRPGLARAFNDAWPLFGSLVNLTCVRCLQHKTYLNSMTTHEHSDYLYPFLLFSCGKPREAAVSSRQQSKCKCLPMNIKPLQSKHEPSRSLSRRRPRPVPLPLPATSPSLPPISPLSPPLATIGVHPFTPLHGVADRHSSSPKTESSKQYKEQKRHSHHWSNSSCAWMPFCPSSVISPAEPPLDRPPLT